MDSGPNSGSLDAPLTRRGRMPRKFLYGVFVLCLTGSAAWAQSVRNYTFHYAFTVRNVPEGSKVRIWIPQAQTDAFQDVKVVSATGDIPLKSFTESKYKNRLFYAETKSSAPELHFEVVYDVNRRERVALGPSPASLKTVKLSREEKTADLSSDA